jgi:RNA polymerase sigma-70 factor (ECF subfamily)
MYRATLPDVYGYLMVHTGGNVEVAEDLTSETFLHASRHCARGSAGEVTPAWLMTVAKRRLVDHWRRRSSAERRAARLAAQSVREADDGSERHAPELAAGDVERVYGALDTLHPDQRLVLVLRHFDGQSVREIAETISRTPKATESLLGRARLAFRAAYTAAHPRGGEPHG